MANLRIATPTQNSLASQLATLINANGGGGAIRIYDGVQPVNPNTPVGSQNLLATLTFSDPPFFSPAAGVINARAIPSQAAVFTGQATWARVSDAAGNAIFDCDVDVSGATINLNTTDIVIGGPVLLTAFSLTIPRG